MSAFDIAVTTHGTNVTTLTTGSFTIGAGANRAAVVCLYVQALFTGATVSLGGVAATPISGASVDFAAGLYRVALFQVINPPSGSQTVTASWTGSGSASLAAIVVSGGDQTAPCINAVSATGGFGGSPVSVTITSTSGDLTVSFIADSLANLGDTTNQTQEVTDYACGDIGPGTGTTTHTWTPNGLGYQGVVGTNILAAATGGGGPLVGGGELVHGALLRGGRLAT